MNLLQLTLNPFKTLYKAMAQENKHTTGQVNNDLHDGNIYSGGIVVANCYSSLLMPKTIKANAVRFTKAWNEYEGLQSKVKELEKENDYNKKVAYQTSVDNSNMIGKILSLEERNKVLEDTLQPFYKLADAVFADTLKTNESPLYGYNDAVIFVRDLTAVKEALSNNQNQTP